MNSLKYICLVFVTLVAGSMSFVSNIDLEHDVGGTVGFVRRGNVSIPSLATASKYVVQEALTLEQQNTLKLLAQKNGFYRLRATITYTNGAQQTFLSSSKACGLVTSQLYDTIWITLDASSFVTSITHSAIGPLDCSALDLTALALEDFNTDVFIKHMEAGPIPDTATFIQKVEKEREARERGDVRDNRGFFAKYWMYIVPVVLLVFISGATNQDAAK